MKISRFILLVAIALCFVTSNHAQKGNYPITNGFSVFGGITKFNIATDNFVTSQGDGFLGGMSATVDIPLRWYNISFGMQLSENNIDILGRPTLVSTENEFVNYNFSRLKLPCYCILKQYQTILQLTLALCCNTMGN